jgi:hypothetical protein
VVKFGSSVDVLLKDCLPNINDSESNLLVRQPKVLVVVALCNCLVSISRSFVYQTLGLIVSPPR